MPISKQTAAKQIGKVQLVSAYTWRSTSEPNFPQSMQNMFSRILLPIIDVGMFKLISFNEGSESCVMKEAIPTSSSSTLQYWE